MKTTKMKRWLTGLLAVLTLVSPLNAAAFAEPAPEAAEPAPAPEAPKEKAPAPEASQAEESAPETEAPAPEAPKAEEAAPETPEPEAQAPAETPVEPETEAPAETPAAPETEAPAEGSDPEATENPPESANPEVPTETPAAEETPAPSATPKKGKEMLPRSHSEFNTQLNPASLRYPSDGMPIPLLYQQDYTRGVCEMDDETRSVATSGCGAVAASMVIAYIRSDYNQTPYTLFYAAAREGIYAGNGLNYWGIRKLLGKHDVSGEERELSAAAIKSALKNGQPIIINMGEGEFSDDGHFIVLRGLNDAGRVLVNDPSSSGNSASSYPIEQIVEEAKLGRMLVITTKRVGEGDGEMPIVLDRPTTNP